MRLADMPPTKPTGLDKDGKPMTAFIASAGIPHPTLTMHTFSEAVLAPDPDKGWLHPQWDHMYKCDVTGAARKFGVADATDITARDQAAEEGGLA